MPRETRIGQTAVDVTREAMGVGEKITVGATSLAEATQFPAGTRSVRFVANVDTFVEVGPAATVAAVVDTSFYVPANVVEYLTASPGDKVAVLQVSAGGFAWVRPCN
jgi:hypothetical protein